MNKEFRFVKYKGEHLISTVKAEKIDKTFLSSDITQCFYRPIDIEKLMDIYDYQLIAIYDSKLEGISNEWNLMMGQFVIEENRIQLVLYTIGRYDGWEFVDRDFHRKWVKNTEFEGAKIRYIYEKKNGIEYNPPLIEERNIEVSELFKYYQHYKNI